MIPDGELLRRYTETNSESAFTELVERHVALVYSAALRQVNGDAHLAQDVAQTVFADLARKAASLAGRPVLTGWLYTSAHFAAAKAVRTEQRRQTREKEAQLMNQLLCDPAPGLDWEKLRPVLDAVMLELNETDREAVLLRYFDNRPHAEIADRLGLSENAARMRVERALEKLHALLSSRGVGTTAALSAVISANAVQVAPAGLAATLSTAALAGTTIATTTTATAVKTIAMTTLQKTIIGATLAVAVGTGIYEARRAATLRIENQTLQQQQGPLTEQIRKLQRDHDDATNRLALLAGENERLKSNTAELLKLRGQVGFLRHELADTKGRTNQPDSPTNDLANTWVIGGIKWKPASKDLGLSSPDAAVQTYWWAVGNTNAERIKQAMCFDRVTNCIPVSDLFAKRESRANQGFYQGGWAARLAAVTQYSPYRASLQIDWMIVPSGTVPPFNSTEPPKWNTHRTETLEVMRNEPDGE
jgi:RNA polymerase sigma factor (sigma-70 family)